MIRVEGLVKKGHNMAKFFNSNNNATIDNQAQETEQSNKLGWLRTGLLVAGGAAATIGGVIGARKLYEYFTDLDGELDSADYDDVDDDPGMGDTASSNETDTSTSTNPENDFNDFMEVEPESNSETTIFTEVTKENTSVENVQETNDEVSEKPVDPVVPGTFDPIEGYRLPEGRSWKSLVRPQIFEVTKDLEDELNKLDFTESPFVIRCANSVFDRVENVEDASDWERLYIDNLYKDFYSYVVYAMDAIADRYKDSHQFEDLAKAKALFDEFVNSPLCNFRVGKKLKAALKELREEAKQMTISEESKEDSDGMGSETNPVVADTDKVVSPEKSSTDAEAETAATIAETVPASAVTKEAPQSDEAASDNSEALDQFSEDMDFLKKLMTSGNYKGAQTFFRDTFSSYLVDENVSDELKSELDGIRSIITDAITNKVTPRPARQNQKKKGGKRSYKKNGRK